MLRTITPRKLALLGTLGLVATLLAGCPPPPPPPAAPSGTGTTGSTGGAVSGELIIGHFASLTGDTADFGQTTDKGVKLAVEELNAAGGGLTVKSETLDDASQQAQAPLVVGRLISQYQATAIVGEVASSRSIAAAPVADSKQVPMVSSASTNPDVTVDPRTGETHPYVFRVCYTDPFQGAVIARFVREHLKLSKAAILKDVKNAYSVGLAKGFVDKFTKIGGTIVAEEAYSAGDMDFNAQLTNIRGKNPEVLIVPGYYKEVGLVVKQTRSLGLKIPIMGGDGWDSPNLTGENAQDFTDCYFSNHFSPEEERPGVEEFVAAFKKKYNEEPNALAALGYDAVKIIADAAHRAGSLDRTALRDALANTKGYSAVTGEITMDAQHNSVKSAVVVQVPTEPGKPFKLVTTIKPD